MSRKFPMYIVIDTSFSMRGRPVEQINAGLKNMVKSLRKSPALLEIGCVSIITYNTLTELLLPLTPLYKPNIHIPDIQAGGKSNMGAAFELLDTRLEKEVTKGNIDKETKGDFRPAIYLLTDGAPSDAWKNKLKVLKRKHKPLFYSFGTANAKMDLLESISGENTVDLREFHNDIESFLEMVSYSILYSIEPSASEKIIESDSSVLPFPHIDGCEDLF
jgi:uncharacterized protein YegL